MSLAVLKSSFPAVQPLMSSATAARRSGKGNDTGHAPEPRLSSAPGDTMRKVLRDLPSTRLTCGGELTPGAQCWHFE